jgi:hypothetical protein
VVRKTIKSGLAEPEHALPANADNLLAKSPIGLNQNIRKRAHEIYLQKGKNPGSAVSDWLQAEKELSAQAAL